jgi:hypothetical protein
VNSILSFTLKKCYLTSFQLLQELAKTVNLTLIASLAILTCVALQRTGLLRMMSVKLTIYHCLSLIMALEPCKAFTAFHFNFIKLVKTLF